MTKRYTGGVVSSSLPTVNAAGASGVFLLSQQSDYQSRNAWPPYKVEESLRFRGGSVNAFLNRTPASTSNRRTWTWSGWIKLGSKFSDGFFPLFGADATGYPCSGIALTSFNIQYFSYTHPVYDWQKISTMVLRDPSAWYHIVAVTDTTNATAEDRAIVYVNGQRVTSWSTNNNPSLNYEGYVNSSSYITKVGRFAGFDYFDGYMSEINFVDGQALTPSSFGAADKDGNWSPIAYTGTHGTNGFYVNFRDNTSATTMGYDYSGNGNNLTLNNFNVSTANTTYDIMIDVPEDQSDGTANNRGSYCTFNPLDKDSDITTSNGNLAASTSTVAHNLIRSTIAIPSSGKFYAEMSFNQTMSGNPAAAFALIAPTSSLTDHIVSAGNYSVYGSSSTTLNSGATSGASVTGMTSGQTWQIAVDADNNQAWVGLNNAWFNVYTSGATTGNPSTNTNPTFTGTMAGLFFGADFVNSSGSINFGQRPFAYAPPTGFKALNTFNLPEPTIKQPNKYMDVLTWTGNGASSRAITGLNFQPDWVWDKMRSDAYQHAIVDAVRGGNQVLHSNSTSAEDTNWQYGYVSSFNSNGFTIQAGSTSSENWNLNGSTFVAWNWNAGGSTVTNTSGSISAQVRANPTAGFSVVTYTSPNTVSDETVGHGLGAAPQFIITKNRDTSWNWDIWHKDLSSGYGLVFESGAEFSGRWSTTTPTSSVFTVKYNYEHVSTNKFVAYCFAPIAGYSAFGKYTGNGSTDGPFVYTGFRPRWILIKVISGGTGSWILYDTARNTYNVSQSILYPNLSNAEATTSSANLDILSNGFKLRTSNADFNGSGYTYIYSAFAEMPFKYARAR